MVANHKFINIVYQCSLKGYPLEGVYRRIQDRELFLIAYNNLYANQGAMTKGSNPADTIDGMSVARIEAIIAKLNNNTYHWTPVRRTYINKQTGGKRPLGILSWSDKLLQEVIRMVLEAYYEPRFSEDSHGFRPNRGCHTALQDIRYKWTGTKWFIEVDIRSCFDEISHPILLNILAKDIKDNRFLKLIRQMLKAGYLENWQYHRTYSGVPQGSGCSPVLANILLNELDQFVANNLIPKYTKGQHRRPNPQYLRIARRIRYAKQKGDWATVKTLAKAKQGLNSKDPNDPNFRRLKSCRYADDILLGFAGPRQEAEEIKAQISQFLASIGLEMSPTKTLITHAATERARFLNYHITVATAKTRPHVNYKIRLLVPPDVKAHWLNKYTRHGKPSHKPELLNLTEFEIVETYGRKFRGITNYYALAENVSDAFYPVKHVAIASATRTLANKRNLSIKHVYRRYYKRSEHGLKALIVELPNPNNPDKPYRAQLGEKPIKRQAKTFISDQIDPWKPQYSTTELTQRLLADQCELCGSTNRIQVHHIKKLAELKRRYRGKKNPPLWVKQMITRHRKTLIVCTQCHQAIHAGKYDRQKVNQG